MKDITWTLPNTDHSIFLIADFSFSVIGCVLFQINDEGKRHIDSYNSRSFTTNEQKLCTTYRELIGIVQSVTKYEHNTFGSDHFIFVLSDQNQFSAVLPKKETFLQYFTLHKCN